MQFYLNFPEDELLTEDELVLKKNTGLIKNAIDQIFPNIKFIADNHRMEVADLYQVGMLALWKAKCNYDGERSKFSTYATATIKGYIYNHIRDSGYMLKFPAGVPTKVRKEFQVIGDTIKDKDGEEVGLEKFLPLEPSPEKIIVKKLTRLDRLSEARCIFSEKENVVIDYLLEGVEMRDIHRKMGVTRQLVNLRKQSIMKKLGMK